MYIYCYEMFWMLLLNSNFNSLSRANFKMAQSYLIYDFENSRDKVGNLCYIFNDFMCTKLL